MPHLANLNLVRVFKSKYCQISFAIFFILSFFLIPEHVLTTNYLPEIILFMILFSLNITCIIFDIRQKLKIVKPHGKSLITFIFGILGLSALQFCGLHTLTCSGTLLISLFSSILPQFIFSFMTSYGIWILRFSILVQLISLYNLKCFVAKTCPPKNAKK